MTTSAGRSSPGAVESWALPGELARAVDEPSLLDPRRAAPRTTRDWIVDSVFFVVAVGIWLAETRALLSGFDIPAWLFRVDLMAGALMCVAMWWRRRFPVALGLMAAVVGSFSNSATGASLVCLFSLALHRGWRWSLPVTALALALGLPYLTTYFPAEVGSAVTWVVLVALLLLVVMIAGLAVRARRQVLLVLRERADAARREEGLRLERARDAERERIAREMHDVLAHRLSLLAVHAGALEYRVNQVAAAGAPPLTPADLERSVGVVRSNAHLALEELRGVLQVLRGSGEDDDGAAPPAPTLAGLPRLVQESESAGQRVRFTLDVPGDGADDALRPIGVGEAIPDGVQRTVYRVVQEGLTNARKHAPGAEVHVRIQVERGLAVVAVANPVPIGVTSSELPGARTGLHGLGERVRLHVGRDGDRGTVTHGIDGGQFRLDARIPWEP
ncbi:histidine kinase [Beutenbergia cavernae DSM 12333]|uniref:histidine kinase n=1 Tax=Beutenbergia cavernae (strain ATCC BAA-8 / DSM 12333 / CCUG 43141 / JCM 11478 / NBRC 16432 / NCIMB 13614 / HKI 0122) TaxID=471853 RepID=C5BXQ2_BEUC1|nr:histidine kinase [Beutenbergia cavernae]ACQ80935.1 histidine kinase [Beutenbergia cavernae DSM 12333]